MQFHSSRCNVRKLLYINILVASALLVAVVGCGGSPTVPTTTATSQTAVTSPAPAPVPTPAPAPSPAPGPPPAPPAPEPTPAESPVRYAAHVDTVHWYGTPLFTSNDIEILRYPDRIVLGSLTLPIVVQDELSVVARTRDMSFSAVESSWSFNGIAGQGSGVWTKPPASE
jgi:hypothetical protein